MAMILLTMIIVSAQEANETTNTTTGEQNETTTQPPVTNTTATSSEGDTETNTTNNQNQTASNETVSENNQTPVEAINETTEPTPTPIPSLVCSETQCDVGCVVCSDSRCHPQGFNCTETAVIEKFLPKTISVGKSQINILVKNTGTVNLKSVSILITGDGIATQEQILIEMLASGDKDYVFVTISAEKAGTIDIVMKLFVDGVLKTKTVEQLEIKQEQIIVPEEKEREAATNARLDQAKAKYRTLEEEYQNKRLEGYPVEIVYDNLKKASEYLRDAQFSLFGQEYTNAQNNLQLAEETLTTIEEELKTTQKKKETLRGKLQSNILILGSIAAALASIFTAYILVKSHINKQKLLELQQKLKLKRKEGMQEGVDEEKPKGSNKKGVKK